jgi:hypothetical protein
LKYLKFLFLAFLLLPIVPTDHLCEDCPCQRQHHTRCAPSCQLVLVKPDHYRHMAWKEQMSCVIKCYKR